MDLAHSAKHSQIVVCQSGQVQLCIVHASDYFSQRQTLINTQKARYACTNLKNLNTFAQLCMQIYSLTCASRLDAVAYCDK